MGDFKFEVKRHIGQIKRYENGWYKALNIISWNNGAPKYDIRDWDSTNAEKMGRGITLFEDEMKSLYELLKAEFEPCEHCCHSLNCEESEPSGSCYEAFKKEVE